MMSFFNRKPKTEPTLSGGRPLSEVEGGGRGYASTRGSRRDTRREGDREGGFAARTGERPRSEYADEKQSRFAPAMATGTNPRRGVKQPGNNLYAGSFAPNPSFIRLLRFLLYCLSSGSALVTAGLAISVVQYYNAHEPSIKPSWGSLIALIVFGIITPGALFGTLIVTPRLFNMHGNFLAIVNQVRIDLLLQFGLAVIWVSGALAMASDLRGYENCIWDGYYYYPKPTDFNHVCDLINVTVIMGYVTFGLVALQWYLITAIAVLIFLFLDQEVLTEFTNDMGGRAYRARTLALASRGARSGYGGSGSGSRQMSNSRSAVAATGAGAGVGAARAGAGETGVEEGVNPFTGQQVAGNDHASRRVPIPTRRSSDVEQAPSETPEDPETTESEAGGLGNGVGERMLMPEKPPRDMEDGYYGYGNGEAGGVAGAKGENPFGDNKYPKEGGGPMMKNARGVTEDKPDWMI